MVPACPERGPAGAESKGRAYLNPVANRSRGFALYYGHGRRAAAAGIGRMANLFDLQGRVAVVVGGTSGIGRVLALGLADAGADVVASARRVALVEEVAAEIEAKGRKTLRIETDVLDRSSLSEAAAAIE